MLVPGQQLCQEAECNLCIRRARMRIWHRGGGSCGRRGGGVLSLRGGLNWGTHDDGEYDTQPESQASTRIAPVHHAGI